MAKRSDYGKGKTVKEIFTGISRNLSRVKDETLRAAVTRLSSAMNKRLSRAVKSGEMSPAVRDAMTSGGKFSAKGKDRNGLLGEFIRLKNFFTDPTSTRKGWEKVQKEATGRTIAPASHPGPAAVPGASAPPPAPEPVASEHEWKVPDWAAGAPVGWMPPEDWEYDASDGTWHHPDYGSGWVPYEYEGGGVYDPITGEIVGNQDRHGHDWDATIDPKRWEKGNETGKIWEMVDSLVKFDPRFARQYRYNDGNRDARNMLFNAIDDAWVENPGWSFEDARDHVATQLNEIYQASDNFIKDLANKGVTKTPEELGWGQ